jgi:TolB protein
MAKFGFALALLLPLAAQDSAYLKNPQQLTHGGQNAEAYWAPDGKRLVFQTTREPYGCDQIFIMNADGSDQHLVSTGKGRTTCAYFLKDNKHIVYGSTHEAGDACPPPPDRSKGYLWGVFSGYEIYLATDAGKIVKKLTKMPGYDAEATVNFKTGRIIYTSMESGDLDLWTMKSDGTDKKQLTNTRGYDGGAVYSRDGKHIVWRANHPQTPETMARYNELLKENLTAPMKMELFISGPDGKDKKQITNNNCANFAPTFTPDGKRIIFSSNMQKCDGRDFELYIVNTDGTGLKQITATRGSRRFRSFRRTGKSLCFRRRCTRRRALSSIFLWRIGRSSGKRGLRPAPLLRQWFQPAEDVADAGCVGGVATETVGAAGLLVVGALLVGFHGGVGQLGGTDLIAAGWRGASDGPGGADHEVVFADVAGGHLRAHGVVDGDDFGVLRGGAAGVRC